MAFFENLRLNEFGFKSSCQSSTSSSTTSLCSRHKDSKTKPSFKMEGIMEVMLKPIQVYKLPGPMVIQIPNKIVLLELMKIDLNTIMT